MVNGGPKIETDGLVFAIDRGSYRCYPDTGSIAYDLAGTGVEITLEAESAAIVSSSLNTFAFDGNGADALHIPGNVWPAGGDVTVEMLFEHHHDLVGSSYWVYTNSPVPLYIYHRGDWGGDNLYFLRRVSGLNYYGDSAWNRYTGVYVDLAADTRAHITFTHDASSGQFKGYLNGSLVRTRDGFYDGNSGSSVPDSYGSLDASTTAITIGNVSPSAPFEMYLFRIYNRVLSDDEVSYNYTQIRERFD